jgi:hypothetical protein
MNSPRTSSYSGANGECVEVGNYRKASYSVNNGACVEVGAGSEIGVRDTKQAGQPDRTELRFSGVSWGRFVRDLKARS